MDDEQLPQITAPMAFPPPVIEVEASPQSKKKRAGLWIGLGVVVAALAAVVVVLVTRDSSTTYSLRAAARTAVAASGVEFESDTTAAGQSVHLVGRVDMTARRMAATTKVAALGDSPMSIVFDLDKLVMYMDASAFASGADAPPTKWVSFDLGVIPGLDKMFAGSTSNPLDAAHLFTDATDVKDMGMDTVKGVPARHYAVSVTLAQMKAKAPELFAFIDKTGVKLPDVTVYDVWVDKGNQLRRIKYEMPLPDGTSTVDTTYTSIGAVAAIDLPPKDQVTDITDIMKSATGG